MRDYNEEKNGEETEVKRKSTLESLKIRGVKTVLVCFMTYAAMELMLGLWGATYLTSIKSFEPSKAAAWVSLYYGGIGVGLHHRRCFTRQTPLYHLRRALCEDA